LSKRRPPHGGDDAEPIDIGDLAQDGMIGLIDAAHRFREDRGIKFETSPSARPRAMIDAAPRRLAARRPPSARELDAAREALRREVGHEPPMPDLAARRVRREMSSQTIVRINTIESVAFATGEHLDDHRCCRAQRRTRFTRHRVRLERAIASAPPSSRCPFASARSSASITTVK
jgi:DNA-directed RNA polymerase specialized sigma subunit